VVIIGVPFSGFSHNGLLLMGHSSGQALSLFLINMAGNPGKLHTLGQDGRKAAILLVLKEQGTPRKYSKEWCQCSSQNMLLLYLNN
jgi:hypothetical protein